MRGGKGSFHKAVLRLRFLPALLLPPLVLTGCWDRLEVNDVAFVLATATDLEQGKIRATVQIALPSSLGGAGSEGGGGGTSGNKTYLMLSETAPTPYQANQLMQSTLSRTLNFSHRRVTILGEDFAKAGIGQFLDIFGRYPQNRLTTYIVLSRGPGYKLLGVDAPIEQSPSEMIRELTKSAMKDPVCVQSLVNTLLTEGIDLAIPVMETKESAPKRVGEGQSLVKLSGLGVFRNNRLVGYLNSEQGQMALMAMGQALNPKVTLKLDEKYPEESVTVVLTQNRAKLRPHLQGSDISFDIEVKARGLVLEDTTHQNLQFTMMADLEKRCNEYITEAIQEVVQEAVRKHRADIFGLGVAFNNKYPAEWKKIHDRWHEKLPEVEVRVHSEIRLESNGEVINSLGIKEERLENE
ncbi:Ger(x)C family spore germination protein [Paenibacillus phocaensis]|uniref:Ger(x)C family spore germination protein n=1 Tax=Paenibacillus phocaensis TaxID=1776378 RepID=UPI000839B29B|nr:Ger(x)C family spore germination protein [Paenibacillus phocaensis]